LGLREGDLEGGSFTGDFERHVKEGSGDGHLSPLGDLGGGDFFTRDFERQAVIDCHKRPKRRPKARQKDDVQTDITNMGIVNWRQVVQDRNGWESNY
jgi:hypothetical protein